MALPPGSPLPDVLALADGLAARGELSRAAAVLRDRLDAFPASFELRERLADVLARDGKVGEAGVLLDELATACARGGMPGRAIAALKKLARLDPSTMKDAGRRIAALAKERDHELAQSALLRGAGQRRRTVSPAGSAEGGGDFELADPGFGARGPGEAPAADTGPDLALGEPGAPAPEPFHPPAPRSPLFGDFSEEELAAVIRGLDLRSFTPGDLVVSQGEPGQSLFLIASGTVKVWVRDGEGRGRFVRTLGEGDFFGEVSLLTGRPRTATVTAATRADILELGWPRVEEIVRDHPRVADVLRSFCDARLKADLAARASDGAAPDEEAAGP